MWLHRDPLKTVPPAWTLAGLHITAQNAVWSVCDQTPWVKSQHDWMAIASAKCNVEGRCLEVMFMLRVHHHAHLREHSEPGWVQARRLLEERLNHRSPDETQIGEIAVEAGDFDRY
ncbi:MAG: hypothetical protein AB7H88_09285 [Vicinamibacterales bacterium]